MNKKVKILLLSLIVVFSNHIYAQVSYENIKQKATAAGIDPATINKIVSENAAVRQTPTRSTGATKNVQTAPEAAIDTSLLYRDFVLSQMKQDTIFGTNIFSNRNLTFAPNNNIAPSSSYVLGPGDEVVVTVWGNSEMTIEGTIATDGTVNIEGVGPVSLSGLSLKEAEKRVSAKVKSIMGGSNIKLALGRMRTIKVNIAGEVVVPGTYTLPSVSTVFNALYAAGGVNPIGSLRKIKVYRNSKELTTIDVYDYIVNGKYEENIRLEDNDMIIASPYDRYVKVTGEVKRPMTYELTEGETVADLLAFCGGFKGEAYKENVTVYSNNGRFNNIYTVDASDYSKYSFSDGDRIEVGKINDRFENIAIIAGAVWRPGYYQISEKMSNLSDLIGKADGLNGEQFSNRGILTRIKQDGTFEALNFNVGDVLSGKSDIKLFSRDSIYIPRYQDMKEKFTINVSGEVNSKREIFPYYEGMTVEDAIVLAGGLRESASILRIEVSRRVRDPKSRSIPEETAIVKRIDVNEHLETGSGSFVLSPFDNVVIRKSPGYIEQEVVKIEGEVLYPGNYVIVKIGERVSNLIKRSGNITKDAYLKGASLKRNMTPDEIIRFKATEKLAAEGIGSDSTLKDSSAMREYTYYVGVDIERALADEGGEEDIVLQAGDVIKIPRLVNTVKVSGSVLYPNSVIYTKGNVKKYINQAGGYKMRSYKRPVVVYMNGKVAATKKFLFFNRYPKVEPGCEIVVFPKAKRDSEAFAKTMGVLNSTTSMAAMIATIANMTK